MAPELVDVAKEMRQRRKRKTNLKKEKSVIQPTSDWDQVCNQHLHVIFLSLTYQTHGVYRPYKLRFIYEFIEMLEISIYLFYIF